HIFAADDNANNERGDNPFGTVSSPPWSQGASLSDGTTFEPRDAQKGATARAMFYFVLRYQNYSNYLTAQESILKTWNKNFLPDAVERKRNSDINSVQHNRNPFVDYPQFADRITSISSFSTTPDQPSIDMTQDTIIYGFVPKNVPVIFRYVIVNNGNVDAHFSTFALSDPGVLSFDPGISDTIIAAGEALGINISLFTITNDSIHGWLTFNTDIPGHSTNSVPVYANDSVFTSI